MKIGLLGVGTVGLGVYEILNNSGSNIINSVNEGISIEKILVNDINKKRNIDMTIVTDNAYDIIDDNNIDMIIELIGGINPAYDYIKRALLSGKHVITANKAVIAKYMKELHEIAVKNNVTLLYEASVAGGIPIIKTLKQVMQINNIQSISGIMNGTSNYILTCMEKENIDFSTVLKRAQDLGYAESDPTDDIDGYDIARKIAILSSLAYKVEVKDSDIKTYGIRNIELIDLEYFKKENLCVKLLASSNINNNSLSAIVEPCLFSKNSVFGQVDSNLNIVNLECDILGSLKLIGQGAGKNPTANAVVSDIIDIINSENSSYEILLNNEVALTSDNENLEKYYIRSSFEKPYDINDFKKELNDLFENIETDGNNLLCITKKIDMNTKEELLNNLNQKAIKVFHARIQ